MRYARELLPHGGGSHALSLAGPPLQRGKTTVLSFPLAPLPATVLADSNATLTFELRGVVEPGSKALPLPFVRLGQARRSQSVLDYATGAVLAPACCPRTLACVRTRRCSNSVRSIELST